MSAPATPLRPPGDLTLFGVVRSWHPADWWPGAGLFTVAEGDLAVVVGRVGYEDRAGEEDRAGDEPDAEDAYTHFDVLTRLVLDGPVLPFPLGTVAPDEDAIREEVLIARGEELRARLDALDDVVEIRVDVRAELDTALRGAAATDASLRTAAATTDPHEQLAAGERLAEAVDAWLRTHADELLAPLTAVARRTTRLDPPDERVERRAYLLPRSRMVEADDVLAVVIGRVPAGTQVTSVGPLPAYSFLDDAEPASGSRWGW